MTHPGHDEDGIGRREAIKQIVAAPALTSVFQGTTARAAEPSGRTAQVRMLREPLVLGDQGSFYFGGQVITGANGDTLHADAAYVKFQAPPDPPYLPIVMWHGGGQHSKTYETTPDGREGYQQIWVRRGHPVYIIDQALRGAASQSSQPLDPTKTEPRDSSVFNIFRLGLWEPPGPPRLFETLSFPRDQASIDQFWYQVPTLFGHEDFTNTMRDYHAAKMGQLLDRIGPSILITHSHGGAYGWTSAMHREDLVRAIVSYEPNVYAFPSDGLPSEIPTEDEHLKRFTPIQVVSPENFDRLTRMPIQVIFGDNIQRDRPNADFASRFWHRNWHRAEQFANAVNRRGGNAEIQYLPDHGLRGNTHFPFADLNNVEVADLLSDFLAHHRLGAQRVSERN